MIQVIWLAETCKTITVSNELREVFYGPRGGGISHFTEGNQDLQQDLHKRANFTRREISIERVSERVSERVCDMFSYLNEIARLKELSSQKDTTTGVTENPTLFDCVNFRTLQLELFKSQTSENLDLTSTRIILLDITSPYKPSTPWANVYNVHGR
jgi:hypothetical protein